MYAITLLGSGEFEPWATSVDRWSIDRSTATGAKVLVVPTASAPEGEDTFQRWARMGIEHYRGLGAEPELVPLRTRDDAFDPAVVDALADARLVFFSGGNPGYLAETLRDTPFLHALRDAAKDGTAIGGCSAGAVFLGNKAPFIVDEEIERWVPGSGLLADAYIAPHFDMLDTYAQGLRDMVIAECPPGSTLVGIDENTALYGDGERWMVAGTGGVWVRRDGANGSTRYGPGDEVVLRLGLSLP